MKLLRGFTDPAAYSGGCVSIGNFDGVHRGHQQMIAALVEQARRDAVPAVVMTFDPHPITLLAPGRVPPRLSTLERKAELLEACEVDVLVAYPTDRHLLSLSPVEFFARVVQGELQARGLVEGPNFCFGKDRAGDVETLRALCDAAGMSLTVVEAVTEGDLIVSSSAVRAALKTGRMSDAVRMLGHPYRLTGRVGPGAGRGRAIGFPTANLIDVETMLPAQGVYAAQAHVEGVVHPAAVHLGPNPTFAEEDSKLEVHVLDFAGDLYGQSLSIDLLARLRATMHFSDAVALQNQLKEDVATIRRIGNTLP
ncbi:MAG: bifunctional riboflavin kinase/FAD synthetase [Planctomycetaceae bacterium]